MYRESCLSFGDCHILFFFFLFSYSSVRLKITFFRTVFNENRLQKKKNERRQEINLIVSGVSLKRLYVVWNWSIRSFELRGMIGNYSGPTEWWRWIWLHPGDCYQRIREWQMYDLVAWSAIGTWRFCSSINRNVILSIWEYKLLRRCLMLYFFLMKYALKFIKSSYFFFKNCIVTNCFDHFCCCIVDCW